MIHNIAEKGIATSKFYLDLLPQANTYDSYLSTSRVKSYTEGMGSHRRESIEKRMLQYCRVKDDATHTVVDLM